MQTSAGIGLMGILSSTVVGSAAATTDDNEFNSGKNPIFRVKGVEMSDSRMSIDTLETIEKFDGERVQMNHIVMRMDDGTVDSVDIGDWSIPTAIDEAVKKLGRQFLDSESYIQTEMSDNMRAHFYPNLTKKSVEKLPADFNDSEPVVESLLCDIFDELHGLAKLLALLRFLCLFFNRMNRNMSDNEGGFPHKFLGMAAGMLRYFVNLC